MKEHYKGHIILVTTVHPDDKHGWNPTFTIRFSDSSRKLIKVLKWDLDYGTPKEAERIGLLVAKKWLDLGKPN